MIRLVGAGNPSTSDIRKRTPLGPFRRPRPRVLGGSYGGRRFHMGEVPMKSRLIQIEWFPERDLAVGEEASSLRRQGSHSPLGTVLDLRTTAPQ